jgi:hypothetical protein
MSIKLGGHLFTGPFPVDTTEVRANQVPAVFAVIAKGGQSWAPVLRVVDIGATPDEGVRFSGHPRRAQWQAQAGESIGVYLFYAPRSEYATSDRERMAEKLRRQYEPPNGLVV